MSAGTGAFVGSKIPLVVRVSLDAAIKNGNYLNASDFIRDAIREKLQREGFMQQISPAGNLEKEKPEGVATPSAAEHLTPKLSDSGADKAE